MFSDIVDYNGPKFNLFIPKSNISFGFMETFLLAAFIKLTI